MNYPTTILARASCCEDELSDLLGYGLTHKPCDIVLRLPTDWTLISEDEAVR